jgi:hypothetical protein
VDDSERPQSNPEAGQPESPTDVSKDTIPAQPATEEQLQQTEQKIEERMSAFERATVRLTKIGVFVGVLTLIIFAGQLYEMIEGGRQADKMITAANTQACAAQHFADTAGLINGNINDAVGKLDAQATAATNSIKATQEAMRLDQRAWVGISQVHLNTPYSAEHIGITVDLLNSGKTPATITAIDLLVTSAHTTEERGQTIIERHLTSSVMAVAPGAPTPFTINEPRGVGDIFFGDLQSRTIQHHFKADIHYRDAFGRKRSTTFCLIVTGKSGDMSEGHPFPNCPGGGMY